MSDLLQDFKSKFTSNGINEYPVTGVELFKKVKRWVKNHEGQGIHLIDCDDSHATGSYLLMIESTIDHQEYGPTHYGVDMFSLSQNDGVVHLSFLPIQFKALHATISRIVERMNGMKDFWED